MVEVLDVSVTQVRFPNASDDQERELAGLIEDEVPDWNLLLSMDRVIAGLDVAERERESANLRLQYLASREGRRG